MKPSIRASSLDQLIQCPGSRTLVAALGCERTDDSASWDGSLGHYEVANRLVNEHGAIPPESGLMPPVLPDGYKLPGFMRWIPGWCVARALEDAGGERAMEVESEMAYEFTDFTLTGHVDFLAVNDDATQVSFADYKMGINPVDIAENNWQLAAYATLLKLQWPTLRKVTGRILQPRNAVEERVSELVLEGDQLEGIATFLEGRIKEALENPMRLQHSQKACRWCPAKLRCPELDTVQNESMTTMTKESLAALVAEPEEQALARICIARKLLQPRFDEGADAMRALLATKAEVVTPDGTRLFLKDRAGIRGVTNNKEAFDRLAGRWQQDENSNLEFVPGLLDQEAVLDCMKFSVPDLEAKTAEVLAIPLDSKKSASAKDKIAETIGEFIVQPTQRVLNIVAS